METKSSPVLEAMTLSVGIGANAEDTDAMVVSVHYSVRENDTERLLELVLNPVERCLQKIDRVASITSVINHWMVDVEVGFQSGATIQDLEAVSAQIEILNFGGQLVVLSRDITLRPPGIRIEP